MANSKTYTDAILEFTDRLDVVEQRIIDKLDKNFEWQRGVDTKLATDKVRLDNHDDDIKNLKIWDRALGILSLIGTTFGIGIKQ